MSDAARYLSEHLHQVYFGNNWTARDLKTILNGITWRQASSKINSFNTIAQLTYHIHYFIDIQRKVLLGGPLVGSDTESFDHPLMTTQEEWDAFLSDVWETAEQWTQLVADLSEDTLHQDFVDPKYGTYYRNLLGAIEHAHYHLGQIAFIKKMLTS